MPAFKLVHKRYYPPAEPYTDTHPFVNFSTVPQVLAKPSWLNIFTNYDSINNQWIVSFQANAAVADGLPAGSYTFQVSVKYWQDAVATTIKYYKATLTVIDTVLLAITPTQFYFNYTIGDAAPALQNFGIVSELNWNITKNVSWVTISQTTGSGAGNVSVGIDPTGLAAGNYVGLITVTDGVFTKQAFVYLTVNGIITPTDYLNITPLGIEFLEVFGTPSTAEKSIEVDSTEAWTTTITGAWLSLDIESGAIGITDLLASVDITGLAIGDYFGSIEFETATFIETVNIVLRISEVATTGIESGELYFADDRNTLSVSNTAANTFALINFLASIIDNIVTYSKKAPFFRGLASMLIGDETENLLNPDAITDDFTSGISSPFAPISFDFAVYDKDFSTSNTTLRQSFTNVKFLNGKTPTVENKLTYLPAAITTTKDAIIALSFLSDETPQDIEITGDVTETIGASPIASTVYTAIINLGDLELTTGNVIQIAVGGQTVTVTIKASEAEHTLLAFENEWQLPEYIMLTGALTITSNKGWETTVLEDDGADHEKILDATHPVTFTIVTGWIYSQEEIDWLDKMFTSKKFYLFINGIKTEVIPTVSRLVPYETREYLRSYSLTFKTAII